MKSFHPPKAATWLLVQFGCSSHNDAVIGDLAEQYEEGQTSWWYWKQTFNAIVRSVLNAIGSHMWLTIRAVAVGWMMLALFDIFRRGLSRGHPFAVSLHPILEIVTLLLTVALVAASGWIVARFSGAHHSAAVLFFAVSFLVYRSIPELAKFLLALNSVDPMTRSRSFVDSLILFPLVNLLPALLILKGGGLLTPMTVQHVLMIDEDQDTQSRALTSE
jgi:hypothetical protein